MGHTLIAWWGRLGSWTRLAIFLAVLFPVVVVIGNVADRFDRPPAGSFYDRFPNADSPEAAEADANRQADALMVSVRAQGVRVDCAGREVDVPGHVWAQLSTSEKRGFARTAARHCRVVRLTLRDAASAKVVATVAADAVTFE